MSVWAEGVSCHGEAKENSSPEAQSAASFRCATPSVLHPHLIAFPAFALQTGNMMTGVMNVAIKYKV